MKMSQSEDKCLKDSGSDWPINMPEVSKRTRGDGRNGTEQRVLEGILVEGDVQYRRSAGKGPVRYCR